MGGIRMTNSVNGLKGMEGFWNRFTAYLIDDFLLRGAALGLQDEGNSAGREFNLVQLVEKARQEWEQAKTLFNEAADPELIDHAIYAVDAAERKYIYLLKQAQKDKVIDSELYLNQENGLV